ncbi:MAG: hypothetical protein DMG32_17435 [Acidobacteria bacterium]|nr:MAG: hypothetical protein DMG32_17435 [Acidobacteriota bacterium]
MSIGTTIFISEFRMGLRRTHGHENLAESAGVRSTRRATVKVVATLDESKAVSEFDLERAF